jgi:hypothetical protein
MADYATIVSIHKTEQLIGGSTLQTVYEVGAESKPHGIYFEFRETAAELIGGQPEVVITSGIIGLIVAQANTLGYEIEQFLATPGVVTMQYVQDVNAAGQLIDLMDVYVQVPGADATSFVTIKVLDLGTGNASALIAEEIAGLQQALSG